MSLPPRQEGARRRDSRNLGTTLLTSPVYFKNNRALVAGSPRHTKSSTEHCSSDHTLHDWKKWLLAWHTCWGNNVQFYDGHFPRPMTPPVKFRHPIFAFIARLLLFRSRNLGQFQAVASLRREGALLWFHVGWGILHRLTSGKQVKMFFPIHR